MRGVIQFRGFQFLRARKTGRDTPRTTLHPSPNAGSKTVELPRVAVCGQAMPHVRHSGSSPKQGGNAQAAAEVLEAVPGFVSCKPTRSPQEVVCESLRSNITEKCNRCARQDHRNPRDWYKHGEFNMAEGTDDT